MGDESARLRFLREARAAARVRHPNVASVFHLGRTGESYFYAMEFVEGETLESLIKRSGRLEVKLALEIVTQVAAGLTTTFACSYTAQVSLPGALSLEAIAGYGRQATGSKYVIIPSRAA